MLSRHLDFQINLKPKRIKHQAKEASVYYFFIKKFSKTTDIPFPKFDHTRQPASSVGDRWSLIQQQQASSIEVSPIVLLMDNDPPHNALRKI